MKKTFFKFLLFIFVTIFFYSTASAATVNVVTKYWKTWGLKWALNTVHNLVNGIDTCPQANTNANATPWCDMSSDAWFDDGWTPSDWSDDSYSGDLIVRTNDAFEVIAWWSWAKQSDWEEKVTLVWTLPSWNPNAYKWDWIPWSCDQAESSISSDWLTITCVRKNFDKNKVWSYSEDLSFPVRVLWWTPNGTTPWDISISISSKNATQVTDDTNNTSLIVTASPHWNLQKSLYTLSYWYEHNWVKWDLIYYKYYIEVDEVSWETDNVSGALWNESLWKDAHITFTDDLSEVSPNAELIDCIPDTLTYLNWWDPYHSYNSNYPDRSVATPDGTQQITCTQANIWENISVDLKHLDASLDHYPTKDYSWNALPVNRYIAAIWIVRVFVPISDVEKWPDWVAWNADDWVLPTKNKLTWFDPDGISWTSNFWSNTESLKDNVYNLTLYSTRWSYDKWYTEESWEHTYHPGWASRWRTWDWVLTPWATWASRLIYHNTWWLPLHNVKMCDVVDANRMEIIPVWPTRKLTDYIAGYMNTWNTNKWEYEFASTYVDDSWLASNGWDTHVSQKSKIEDECSVENSWATIVWHDTASWAINDPNWLWVITKVRIKTKSWATLDAWERFYVWIKHKARDKDLAWNPNQAWTYMINHSAFYDDDYLKSWHWDDYIANDVNTPPTWRNWDRIMLTRWKVRITKEASKTNITPWDEITFTLKSSLTTDVPNSGQEQVVIKDMLPKWLNYVAWSSSWASEPTIWTCADVSELWVNCTTDNTVLIWDLWAKTTNVAINDITYKTTVDAWAPSWVVTNYALIQSPWDSSPVSQRKYDVNLNITVPSSLIISKSVESDALTERNVSPIHFKVSLRNGKTDSDLSNLDIIDVLPFNWDNASWIPFTVWSTTITRHRNPATNFSWSLAFSNASLSGDCTGTETYYYSKQDPSTIDLAPSATTNTDWNGNVTSIWCVWDVNWPDASCGFTSSEVTAIRVRGRDLPADKMCYLDLNLSVSWNYKDNVYTNSAWAFAVWVSNPVLSNDVTVKVVASSIWDYVWNDENKNWIQDAWETPASWIVVKLLDENGNLIKTTTTDANWKYIFTELNSWNYKVQVEKPDYAAWFSPKDAWWDDSKDSDTDSSWVTDIISLAKATDLDNVDIWLTSLSLGWVIWEDSDNNWTLDNWETKKSQVEVKLYKDTNWDWQYDAWDEFISSQNTDASWKYKFINLKAWDYIVVLPENNFSTWWVLEKFISSDDSIVTDPNSDTLWDDNWIQNGNFISTKSITLSDSAEPTNDWDHNNSNLTLDLWVYKKVSLWDKVWLDLNKDWVQDASEQWFSWAVVKLLDNSWNVIATTTTDSSWNYLFENLNPGDYKVEIEVPSDYDLSPKIQWWDNSKDSDFDATTFKTDTITLTSSNDNLDIDAWLTPKPSSIWDKVWIDSNLDWIQDDSEEWFSWAVVKLLDNSWNVIATQTTDANWNYKFENLLPWDYKVEIELPSDYYLSEKNNWWDIEKDSNFDKTTKKTETIHLGPNQDITSIDAWIYKKSHIWNKVWNDINKDWIQDQNEQPMAWVEVKLLDENGNVVATTTTSGTWEYDFEVVPWKYVVEFVKPTWYIFSPKNSTNENNDSNADKTTWKTDLITVWYDETIDTIDAWIYVPTGSIWDKVWIDLNADWKQDAWEVWQAWVKVELLNASWSVVATTTTDANWNYLFSDVVAWDYKIKFSNLPANYKFSPKDSWDDNSDSDADLTSWETDIFTLNDKDSNLTLDAWIYTLASLSWKVVNDKDRNSKQSSWDENLKDVEVKLLDENGNVVATTTTDSNWEYKFENLVPWKYKVKFTRPSEFNRTSAKNNWSFTEDFDINSDQTTDSIELKSWENKTHIDAWFYFHPYSWNGWWGGWGNHVKQKDNCPNWDYTNSRYDWKCWKKPKQEENKKVEKKKIEKPDNKKEEKKQEELKKKQQEEKKKQEELKKKQKEEAKKKAEEEKKKQQEEAKKLKQNFIKYKEEFENIKAEEKKLKEIIDEENEVKQWFKLPKILPQTWTPIEKRTYRRHVKSIEVSLPPKEIFRLAWNTNPDLNFWKQVLPKQDQNKDEYIVIPSNWLVIPVNKVPENTADFNKMISWQEIHVNDYLKSWVMEYPNSWKLGKPWNKVIFGHSSYWKKDDWRYKTHFGKIIELDAGEEVWVYKKINWKFKRFRYRVTKSYNTKYNDVSVLKATKNPTLTLFTCTPIWGIAGRWIIKANYINEEKQALQDKLSGNKVPYKYKILLNKFNNRLSKLDKTKKTKVIVKILSKIDKLLENPKFKNNEKIKNILDYLKILLLKNLFEK